MICFHCGKGIRRSYSDYNNGWVHESGDVHCRQNMAEPDRVDETTCDDA